MNFTGIAIILILLVLYSSYLQADQTGGSNGALIQLVAKGPLDTYLTGINSYDYLPVAWHPDYGFPHYDRAYKYPYYFDRPLA